MSNGYNKVLKRNTKLIIYVVIALSFVLFNVLVLIDEFLSNSTSSGNLRTVVLLSSFIIECIGFLYCVVQDIAHTLKGTQQRFVFDNENMGIPFVDREELLENVILETEESIRINKNYYTRNIKYGERNGKTAFAKKLCLELQKIKDHDYDAVKTSSSGFGKSLGNITYINYASYADSFASRIKTEFTYIKGKKNIIVVDNDYENLFLWTDDLYDPDVFIIILNFNLNSDDALFFADDKIKELLVRLKRVPAFSYLVEAKDEKELDEIAVRLGNISNNNIGTIIDMLSSNEFSILLESDKHFIDFYFSIKHGKYAEATLLYNNILRLNPANNRVMHYKIKYEWANLIHFLGDYDTAIVEIETLLGILCADQQFATTKLGEILFADTILLQAHVKKHRGDFDDAALTLMNLPDDYRGIVWLRSHFSIDIFRMNEILDSANSSEQWTGILNDLSLKMNEFKSKRMIVNSDYFFYEAYYPILAFYKNRFSKKIIPALLEIEDKAIQYYEKEERRYVTNCYFIKAELCRIMQDWKTAEEYYLRCYDIYCHNGDKDILFLVAITCTCIKQFDDVILKIPFDWEKAISDCKEQCDYRFHNRLISQMELANIDAPYKERWLQHYRNTINPIP